MTEWISTKYMKMLYTMLRKPQLTEAAKCIIPGGGWSRVIPEVLRAIYKSEIQVNRKKRKEGRCTSDERTNSPREFVSRMSDSLTLSFCFGILFLKSFKFNYKLTVGIHRMLYNAALKDLVAILSPHFCCLSNVCCFWKEVVVNIWF